MNLLSKLASSNHVDLSVDVWVEVLEKHNMGEEELVVVHINIKED